jgi:hypothetical protein
MTDCPGTSRGRPLIGNRPTVRANLSLPADLMDALRAESRRADVPMSRIVADALKLAAEDAKTKPVRPNLCECMRMYWRPDIKQWRCRIADYNSAPGSFCVDCGALLGEEGIATSGGLFRIAREIRRRRCGEDGTEDSVAG